LICRPVESCIARDGAELAVTNLQVNRSRPELVFAQSTRHLLDLPEQDRSHLFRVDKILAERLFLVDAPGVAVAHHRAIVDAARQPPVSLGLTAERLFEHIARESAQVADRFDVEVRKSRGGLRADAPDSRHC